MPRQVNKWLALLRVSDSLFIVNGMRMIHSDRSYRQVVASVKNPTPRQLDFDFVTGSLIADGHCTIAISEYLKETFEQMVACYANIASIDKQTFSFPNSTDGFLPYGMEHARNTNQVDLCERFCYRQKERHVHAFTKSSGQVYICFFHSCPGRKSGCYS